MSYSSDAYEDGIKEGKKREYYNVMMGVIYGTVVSIAIAGIMTNI